MDKKITIYHQLNAIYNELENMDEDSINEVVEMLKLNQNGKELIQPYIERLKTIIDLLGENIKESTMNEYKSLLFIQEKI